MGGLRGVVVDRGIRSQLAKAACHQERFDVPDQLGGDSSPSQIRLDPDAFQKRNGLAVAAIGVRSDRNLRESDRCAIARFCNKTPRMSAGEDAVDPLDMSLRSLLGSQSGSHVCPDRSIGRSHFSDRQFHDAGPNPAILA